MASLDDAIKILKSGRLREGTEVLEDLVANDPENVDVLYNLGMCYSELGSIDKSIQTLEKCVKLAPTHASALTSLGFSYSRGGEQGKALAKLKAALEIDPDNFFALKNHGAVLAKLGRYLRQGHPYRVCPGLRHVVGEAALIRVRCASSDAETNSVVILFASVGHEQRLNANYIPRVNAR